MKLKDILKFENPNNLNINGFHSDKTVLTPVPLDINYDQPQIDMLLNDSYYCLKISIKK